MVLSKADTILVVAIVAGCTDLAPGNSNSVRVNYTKSHQWPPVKNDLYTFDCLPQRLIQVIIFNLKRVRFSFSKGTSGYKCRCYLTYLYHRLSSVCLWGKSVFHVTTF